MGVQAVKDKVTLIYSCQRSVDVDMRLWNGGIYDNSRCNNYEPFSQRKTNTELFNIFNKLHSQYKTDHNKRYLRDFFPYYVFRSMILDEEGRLVFFIHRGFSHNYNGYNSTKPVLYVTKSFNEGPYMQALKDSLVQNFFNRDIFATDDFKILNIEDLYFHFHKQYEFANIKEIVDFKRQFTTFAKEKILEYIGPEEDSDIEPPW